MKKAGAICEKKNQTKSQIVPIPNLLNFAFPKYF